MISVTFDREALSLADLVITEDSSDTFWLPEDGVSWPDFAMRRTYLPDSDYVGGQQLRSAVPAASTLPLTIYAHADTTAELKAAMAELSAAATQWAYDLTLTIDGESWTYPADPEFPQWGQVDSGMVRAHMARASLTVPVNPIGA